MNTNAKDTSEQMLIDEIQLLLEEKQTSLSIMRMGVLIWIAQIVILAMLIAVSRFYEIIRIWHMLIPFYIINIALMILGGYLTIHSLFRVRRQDEIILRLKKKHSRIAELMD